MDIELPGCHEGWIRLYVMNKSRIFLVVNPLSSPVERISLKDKIHSPGGSSRKRGGQKTSCKVTGGGIPSGASQ